MIPDTSKQPEEVKMLMELYQDRMESRLTQEQLEEACHYWTYDYALNGLKYRPLPSEPFKLKEWKGLPERQREAAPEDVRSNMRNLSSKYFQEVDYITNENRTHLTYLASMLKTFKKYNNDDRARTIEIMVTDMREKGVKEWQ